MVARRNPPLVFLHLPKTAGTTLNTVLRRQFPESAIHLLRSDRMQENIEAFKALPEAHRHRIQLLRGHQAFGLHRYLAPGARYLTVLREPVARVVSHYQYVKATGHPKFIDAIRDHDMSLLDYATSGISGELENGQTRWIAGIWDDRPLTRADLGTALANIDTHFDWVGLTEYFDESLIDLAASKRWHRITYETRNVGVRENRAAVPAAALEAIAERNQLDLELYAEILRRFQQQNILYRGFRRAAAGALQWRARRRPVPLKAP